LPRLDGYYPVLNLLRRRPRAHAVFGVWVGMFHKSRGPFWPNEADNRMIFEWRGATLIQFSIGCSKTSCDRAFLFDGWLPRAAVVLMRKQVTQVVEDLFPYFLRAYDFN